MSESTEVSERAGVARVAEAFARAAADGRRAALMPYLMGGYPGHRDLAGDRAARTPTAAPTWSSSACRSQTRSPTGR